MPHTFAERCQQAFESRRQDHAVRVVTGSQQKQFCPGHNGDVLLFCLFFQVQTENNALKKKLKQVEDKVEFLSELECEHASLTEQYNKTLTDNGVLIKQVDDMYNQIKVLNEVQKTYTEAVDNNALLQTEMKKVEDKLKKLENEYKKLEEDAQLIHEENSELMERAKDASAECEALRGENEKLTLDLKQLKDEKNKLLQDLGQDKEKEALMAEFEEEKEILKKTSQEKLKDEMEMLKKEHQRQTQELERAKLQVGLVLLLCAIAPVGAQLTLRWYWSSVGRPAL